MELARAGHNSVKSFVAPVGPAQAGALMRLAHGGFVKLDGPAEAKQRAIAPVISRVFERGSPGAELLGRPIADEATLTRAAGSWFLENPSADDAASAGYWLADIFLRGAGPGEIAPLARFLIGSSAVTPPQERRTSVRRYPTGGISEKQALILPAILRALAEPMDWCSPFLIARRLAHTGGTLDKLGVLPGFHASPASLLAEWTGHGVPVLYVAAGAELCPRDAAMYRIRGETGTVADFGLMAASILAKQAAAPVDALVLDILHGTTAFLRSAEEAASFSELCVAVGHELGIRVTPIMRAAHAPMGSCIGASTELAEATDLLDPRRGRDILDGELAQAIVFAEALAAAAGRDARLARDLAIEVIESGQAHEHLLALWSDHGVDEEFLRAVRRDAREALLGDLQEVEIRADRDGILRWDWSALAATVNEQVNGFRAAGDGPSRLDRGGLEVHSANGAAVTRGTLLLTAYVEESNENFAEHVSKAFKISRS